MKIFLVGYMGAGKTTAGKKIASLLGFNFIDLDTFIESETKKTINEIFDEVGEDAFRKLEHDTLAKIITEKDNFVLSTGGGTPCFHNNMELINSSGVSVYFKMSSKMLASRLVNAKNKRPLIKDMTEFDLNNFIASNLEKREAYYSQTTYKVKAKDLNVNELAEFLSQELQLKS